MYVFYLSKRKNGFVLRGGSRKLRDPRAVKKEEMCTKKASGRYIQLGGREKDLQTEYSGLVYS